MKIDELAEEFIFDEIFSKGLSIKTEERHRVFFKLLISEIGDDLVNISHNNLRKFREKLAVGRSADTVRGYIICLRKFLEWAIKTKKISIDPNIKINIPKREKRLLELPSNKELDDFYLELKNPRRGYSQVNRLRNVAIFHLILSSGLRNSEICGLNRNSIKNRQMTIIGKSKNPRLCFINEKTEIAISEYLNFRKDSDKALFVSNQNGKRITPQNLQRIFANACEKCKKLNTKITPHTLRHCFATNLLEKQVELCYIADLMGHESLDTTKIYTHYSNEKLRQVYEKAQV